MSIGGRAGALLVVLTVVLALPAAAWGHASLLATQPQASGVLAQPPAASPGLHSDQPNGTLRNESVKDPNGVAASAHTRQNAIGQAPFR